MGQKDMAQKTLLDFEDVFADIVNVLLFDGRTVVEEECLADASERSHYKANDGMLHEQERDVAKYWLKKNVRIALIGMENQSKVDQDMPLRVINYDAAAYRSQLLGKSSARYPVITMVLYFGATPWNGPKTLFERINIPDELKEYVSDYKTNVFEIASLSDEKIGMFKSDFRFFARYCKQMRLNRNYIPDRSTIKHVDAVLKLFDAVNQTTEFQRAAWSLKKQGREVRTMYDVVGRIKEEGRAEGQLAGRIEGLKDGENKLAALMTKLFAAGRTKDAELAAKDAEARKRLYREFGITD